MRTTVFLELGTSGMSAAALARRPPLLLSSAGTPHWLGEPRIGGREGGVNRPDLEDRRGEERGDHCADAGGETVHEAVGGELPQAEPLLPLLVRRR